jgi:hypothetical protein
MDSVTDKGINESGKLTKCRLQGKCAIEFYNGDKFLGIFKDGRPNGKGEMSFKNSIPLEKVGDTFEIAKYIGSFSVGRRGGFGCMYWVDGSSFRGLWKNDSRFKGRMIMTNGIVYEGEFKNDLFNSL